MDRKLKERLIGLVVLLTAAIIVLPMMLGGPDDQGQRRLSLERERPAEEDLPVTRLDLRDPHKGAEPQNEEGRDDRQASRASTEEAPTVRPLEPEEETEPLETDSVDQESAEDDAAEEDAVEEAPRQAEEEPTPEEPAPVEDETAEDETDSAAEEASMPSGSGWAAQVGSFSNRDNADGLMHQLREQGFEAFIMRHERNGRTFYRVRVGLEPDREAAEALARRIRNRSGHEARPVPHP